MTFRFIFILCIAIPIAVVSQEFSQEVNKDQAAYTFGQIYTGFYLAIKDTYKPRTDRKSVV